MLDYSPILVPLCPVCEYPMTLASKVKRTLAANCGVRDVALAASGRDWTAVRAVLIGGVVADVIGANITARGTIQGTVNASGWGSTIVDVLLALWALYCLFTDSRKPA
jgi:hypothetical protein